jgi:hypothetical protein
MKKISAKILSLGLTLGFVAPAVGRAADDGVLLNQLSATPTQTVSTVPAVNGDQNPYGVAFVPHDFSGGGTIHPGDILVSNFNNSGNDMSPGGFQGTGTTIVSITPAGTQNLFFQGSGLGLTTALGVLHRGVVLVGNLPTDSGVLTGDPGSLIAIDRKGKEIASFTDDNTHSTLFDGPWDLTLIDLGRSAIVFLSDVLNGTVVRLVFFISDDGEHITLQNGAVIANGYGFAPNSAALVVGPTGLAFDAKNDELFVASTADNAIFSIPDASKRTNPISLGNLVYQDPMHLFGPLGLVFAPNGDLITSNGDAINTMNEPSLLVEFTRTGQFVADFTLNETQGAGFGIALHEDEDHVRFAAVDDVTNQLKIWDVKEP